MPVKFTYQLLLFLIYIWNEIYCYFNNVFEENDVNAAGTPNTALTVSFNIMSIAPLNSGCD